MRHQGYIELNGTPLADEFSRKNELALELGDIMRGIGSICTRTQAKMYCLLEARRFEILAELCAVTQNIVAIENTGEYNDYLKAG